MCVAPTVYATANHSRKLTWIAEALGAIIDRAGDDHKAHKAEHKRRKAVRKEKSKPQRIFAPFVFRFVYFVVKVELILFGRAQEVNCGQQGR
jgi:hypothetical protein